MKIFVIDAIGTVGHAVSLYFKEKGHTVFGYSELESDIIDTSVGSIYDTDRIKEELTKTKYDAVINCSAVINQDAEKDKASAAFINAFLPHYLEKITAGTDTILVHRSTDCIFSGKRGGYTLSDSPDAESFYARTKAVGEVINDKDITIRTSLIGPETDKNGGSLFNWFYNQTGEVGGFANAIWTGLTTIEFAREIEELLLKKAHGLFQLVPNYAISKYELVKLFEKYFPDGRKIKRIENNRVDKSLVQELGGYKLSIPDYENMISDMAEWIEVHKRIYPHYIK